MSYAFLEDRLSVFLDRVAGDEPAPGGGACAAVTVALAAGLTAMAARFSSTQVPDATAITEQADRLRHDVEALATRDAEAYTEVLRAFRLPRDTEDRKERIAAALSAAAEPPLAVAEAAVQVGAAARRLVAEGNPNLRGDAQTALLLAEAGCRAAAALVAENLAEGEPRLERARRLADSWLQPA